MVCWTTLADVEQSRCRGKTETFPPAIAWVVNYVAPNPWPRKFIYSSCPHRYRTGRICGKSLEYGPKCDHMVPGRHAFRFHIVICDAIHGAVPPLTVQIWDCASILLGCTAHDLSLRSETQQVAFLQSVSQECFQVRINLSVADREVKVQHITLVDAHPVPILPPICTVLYSPECHTAGSSSSSQRAGKSSQKVAIKALDELVRSLNLHEDSD